MKTLNPAQRGAVPGLLMHCLRQRGVTIGEAGAADHQGDPVQMRYRDEPVWHRKGDIDGRIAGMLHLPASLWGPGRLSNDLMTVTAGEIAKLRKRGIVADWSSKKRTTLIRLADPGIDVDVPRMSRHEARGAAAAAAAAAAPARTDQGMMTLFLSIISRSRKDNTYKFALGKTLLDYCRRNAPDGRAREITYDYLAEEFLKHYWYQRYKFRMKQDFHTRKSPVVIQILEKTFGKNPSCRLEDADPDDRMAACTQIQQRIFGLARQKRGMVVPRFQRTMSGNTTVDSNLFYDYDDERKMITLKPDAHLFLRRNYGLLIRALLAEWVRYLERANRGLPMLAAKLYDTEAKRGPLRRYRDLFLERSDHCFYCNYGLEPARTHVDHFIPWSYIFEDSTWNLVLACRDCNLGKTDSLPPGRFVDYLIERDHRYSGTMLEMKRSLRQLSSTRPWEDEIRNHYEVCGEYGFGTWETPA